MLKQAEAVGAYATYLCPTCTVGFCRGRRSPCLLVVITSYIQEASIPGLLRRHVQQARSSWSQLENRTACSTETQTGGDWHSVVACHALCCESP